jgi:hypothetical protein
VEPAAQAEYATTNIVLDGFLAADIIVLGAPMKPAASSSIFANLRSI